MRTICVIDGEPVREFDDGTVTFIAKMAIDIDGIGPHRGDPCAQDDTSLHWGGKALDADSDRYIVLPPVIIKAVKGIVLGCQAFCTNIKNGRTTEAVVGDVGPGKTLKTAKLGEASVACAIALGINPNPNTGGTEQHIIHYSVKPGQAACVNGKKYQLQKYGA